MPRPLHQVATGSQSSQGDPLGLGCLVAPRTQCPACVTHLPVSRYKQHPKGSLPSGLGVVAQPRAQGRDCPHGGGEMGPTLLPNPIASITHTPRGSPGRSGWLLELPFPRAGVGQEGGGTLTAVSPQVSMPVQTCWRAGCPPCCCCGTTACLSSSPFTGEHGPAAPSILAQLASNRAHPSPLPAASRS